MKQFEHIFLLLYMNITNLRCSVNLFERERIEKGKKTKAMFQEVELKERTPFTWSIILEQEIRLLIKN